MALSKAESFWACLKQGFGRLYEHLAVFIALNLLCVVFGATVLLVPLLVLSLLRTCTLSLSDPPEDPSLKLFFKSLLGFSYKQVFGLLASAGLGLLFFYNLFFYVNMPGLPQALRVVCVALSIALSLSWVLICMALWPRLAFSSELWPCLKQSIWQVWDNLYGHLSMLSVLLVFALLCVFSVAGIFVLMFSGLCLLLCSLSVLEGHKG